MLCIPGLTLLAACKDEPEQPASTPTVAITIADLMQGVEDTVTFSEDVTGFTVEGITVAGGSKGAFAPASANVYTLQVTPTTSGSKALTVRVAADAATNSAGNKNAKIEQYFDVAAFNHTVTLALNGGAYSGGEGGNTIQVAEGQPLSLPAESITHPAINGITRTFERWEWDGKPYDLNQPITEAITSSAVWKNSCSMAETI